MATEFMPKGNYLVNKSELPQFIKSLEGIAVKEEHLDNRRDVIYFDNEKHQLYFGQNLRARRYSNSIPSMDFQIPQGREWTFEQRGELNTDNTISKRTYPGIFRFSEIAEWLRKQTRFDGMQLLAPLVPFTVNSYEHMDFLVSGDRRFKITVDNMTKHYAFMDITAARQTGQEDFTRVELKMHNKSGEYNYGIPRIFKKLLDSVAAVPVVSKKDASYNLLSQLLMQESGWKPGQTDTEIEAKLSFEASQQYLFSLIKNDFAAGRVKGFMLNERFTHTLEGAKINTYLITSGNECVRVSAKGNELLATTKEGKEIMKDPYGLSCIIKRREIESAAIPTAGSKEGVNLYKKTKQFMVTGNGGNDYCVSMDGCFRMDDGRSNLYQIEIESTLMQPSKGQEADAVRDIASITKQLIDMHSELIPTTLTKQEWISELRREA